MSSTGLPSPGNFPLEAGEAHEQQNDHGPRDFPGAMVVEGLTTAQVDTAGLRGARGGGDDDVTRVRALW